MVRRLVHLRHDEWDRPRCSICSAGRAGEIDLLRIEKLLADRAKLKAVAAKFGLKHDALRRHWEGIGTDRKNYLRVGRQLSQAALAAALDRNIMHGAQLVGEWQPNPSVQNNVAIFNIPGVASTMAGIARALAPYPEARRAVMEFLKGKNGAAVLPAPEVIDVAAE